MIRELRIRPLRGPVRVVRLEQARYTLGRAETNELAYPEESGLSRQHVAFERAGREWQACDLGSKNGTRLNGQRLDGRRTLQAGDLIECGALRVECGGAADGTVVFVPEDTGSLSLSKDIAAIDASGKTPKLTGSARQIETLLKAGRELVSHRPLDELFPLILDLALESAGAARGAVLTMEQDELVVRATLGDHFRISGSVRDRVLHDRQSLLVRDTSLDQALHEQRSIVENNVRSLMAAPLQAGGNVIGLIYVDTPGLTRPFTKEDLELLTVLANVAAVRIENSRLVLVEEQEERMRRELQQAAEIQIGLLPSGPPRVAGLDLAGYNAPCLTVGGDYYDYLCYEDGRVLLIVADVAGKGMPAALMVSSLQARVQILAGDQLEPAVFVKKLNEAVSRNCPGNRFITFFAGLLHPGTGEITFCNAGHNPPLVVRASGVIEQLPGTGLILGIMGKAAYEEGRARLEPGDVLVLYSDGVTEAAPPDRDEEFGEERLGQLIHAHRGEGAGALIDAVKAQLRGWLAGGAAADDVTLVIARRTS